MRDNKKHKIFFRGKEYSQENFNKIVKQLQNDANQLEKKVVSSQEKK